MTKIFMPFLLLMILAHLGWSGSFTAQALSPNRLPTQFLIEQFDREDGLPADVVWAIEQDQHGYLWLGTQNGLVRYDGARFVTFNNLDEPSFSSNDVRSLLIDQQHRLWIGTYGGGLMLYGDGHFQRVDQEGELPHGVVYDITQSSDGAIWVATGGGVSRWINGEWKTWTTADGLIDNRVFRAVEAPDGAMWFATFTSGISRFDGQQFNNFSTEQGLQSNQLHMLERLRNGQVIGGSYDGALYSFTGTAPDAFDRGNLPTDLSMQTALLDQHGTLWVGSYGQGLWQKRADGSVRSFAMDQSPGSHIFELYQDREGLLWVASMQGLYRLKQGRFLLYGEPEGLSDSTFVITQQADSGHLLIGTEMNGLLELDANAHISGRSARVDANTTETGLASNSVSALLIDSQNRQWVGTFGRGLHVFEAGQNTLLTQQDGLASNHIFSLAEDASGAIWIGAQAGLSRFEDGRITTYGSDQQLAYRLIRHILPGRDNTLWLSTNDGLLRRQGDSIRLWSIDDGLQSNLITVTHMDANGTLWIGSRNGGLARLSNDDLFQYTRQHGVPRQSAMSINEDDQGNLWVSSNDGLMRMSISDLNDVAEGRLDGLSVRLFDTVDGLRSTQFMGGFTPSSLRSENGWLWFPTNAGLVGVDPAQTEPEPKPLQIRIESIRVNGQRLNLDPIRQGQRLELPAAASSLEIDYTTPVLAKPERIRYRYRLPPLDNNWQQVGDRRTAFFTSLKPRLQQFEVEAWSQDGSYQRAGEMLEIYREPYWHQLHWVRLLALFGMALLLWAAYRAIIHQSNRRQLLLEQLVEQRTSELKQALEQVESISRTDALTGVYNRGFFEESLKLQWDAAVASSTHISVIMIDIDRFKQYNDLYGHQMGDDCLRKVASRLHDELMRKQDLIARYGGEEFVVLLPDTHAQAAYQVAERIRTGILDMQLQHGDSDVADFITISAGCATASPGQIDSASQLIERADQALYKAKREGRNRVISDW